MLKLVIADDEGKKTVVPLVRDEITIGRKEGNTIRLTERNVSRRHARIVKRAQDYVLEDLASYNGIVVNNARLLEAKPIRHGDEIRIGDYVLQILDEPGVQAAPPPPPPPPPSEPIVPLLSAPAPAMPAPGAAATTAQPPPPTSVPESIKGLRIVFLAPAGVPAPVMLDRLPMVMGRSEGADVALPFSSISREHARVFLEDDVLMIEDLGSSNGIQVNGEKTKKSPLGPGDMVQLGVVEFRVARRGDSTVVIQKAAADEKQKASRRVPVGLVGAIVGGGLVLGLSVVLAFNKMNTPSTEPQQVAVAPPVAPPVAAPNAPSTPTPPAAAPEQPPAAAPPAAPEQPVAAAPEQPPAAPPAAPEQQPAAPQPPAAPPAQAPTQPEATAQPNVEAPPVRQELESPRERRAREQREQREAQRAAERRTAAAAPPAAPSAPAARAAPPPPPPPPPPPSDNLSPMERVQQCRSGNASEPERNNCIVGALRSRASSDQELRMLAATYMAMGRTQDAVRTMRTYIQRYPEGSMSTRFQEYIARNSN